MQPIEEHFPLVLDATQRSCFVSCPRKFYYEFVLGLCPPHGNGNIHLRAGGAVAKACEVARKEFYGNGLSEEDSLALGLAALISSYGPDHEPDSLKSLSRTIDAYLAYFGAIPNAPGACNMGAHRLGHDPYPPYLSATGPAVEFSFSLELDAAGPDSESLSYYGRFDQIVTSDFGLLGSDEKTGSAFSKDWSAKWALRGQFLGYIHGARQAGVNLAGMLARGIIFQKTQFHFPEALILPPNSVINDYHQQLNYDVKYMVGCWKNDFWPQNFSDACTAFSGCPYAKLCESPDPSAWYTSYNVERWDPTIGQRVVLWAPPSDDNIPSPFEEF
jgi:hypothetical protein